MPEVPRWKQPGSGPESDRTFIIRPEIGASRGKTRFISVFGSSHSPFGCVFADGDLFADGTWITSEGRGLLRAADLFSVVDDGRIEARTVVWTHATAV